MAFAILTGAHPKSKNILRNKSLNNLRILVNNKNHRATKYTNRTQRGNLQQKQHNHSTTTRKSIISGKLDQILKIRLLSKD